jgi:hypothetical protein
VPLRPDQDSFIVLRSGKSSHLKVPVVITACHRREDTRLGHSSDSETAYPKSKASAQVLQRTLPKLLHNHSRWLPSRKPCRRPAHIYIRFGSLLRTASSREDRIPISAVTAGPHKDRKSRCHSSPMELRTGTGSGNPEIDLERSIRSVDGTPPPGSNRLRLHENRTACSHPPAFATAAESAGGHAAAIGASRIMPGIAKQHKIKEQRSH